MRVGSRLKLFRNTIPGSVRRVILRVFIQDINCSHSPLPAHMLKCSKSQSSQFLVLTDLTIPTIHSFFVNEVTKLNLLPVILYLCEFMEIFVFIEEALTGILYQGPRTGSLLFSFFFALFFARQKYQNLHLTRRETTCTVHRCFI